MKEMLKEMLSNKDNVSSKRVMGSLCVILSCVLISIVVLNTNLEISATEKGLILSLFGGGLLLFGVTAAEKLLNK